MLSYAYYFKYRNQTNKDFDLITSVSFDAGFDQIGTATAVEGVTSDKYDGTRIDYSSRYLEQVELQITMIKKDYTDFTREDKRAILRWLSANKQASWIQLYDDEGGEIIEFFGRFTSVEEKTADSRTIGMIAVFTSPFPYGFSPLRKINQTFIGSEIVKIQNDTDVLDEYVRPYFTIMLSESVDRLSVKNINTNTTVFIEGLQANETLTLDNENKLAFTDIENREPEFYIGNCIYGDIDGYLTREFKPDTGEIISSYPVFIELVPGINKLFIDTNTTSCECKYSFSYRYPIKLGAVV